MPAGDTIEFTFSDMDIETGSGCRWDYVELRDGGSLGSNSLGKFCGATLPSPARYISSGNQLFVKIRSDASVTGRGFTASWKIGSSSPVYQGRREPLWGLGQVIKRNP